MGKAEERVQEIYNKTVMIDTLITEIEKSLQREEIYWKNNWTVAISGLNRDLKQIDDIIKSMGLSLDYKQGNHFSSLLNVYRFILDNLLKNLIIYEEGMHSIKIIISLLRTSSLPFMAFVCSRVRDLGVLNDISPVSQKLYKKMESEIDELVEADFGEFLDLAYMDFEELDDIEIDEVKDRLSMALGRDLESDDLAIILEQFAQSVQTKIEDSQIQFDF